MGNTDEPVGRLLDGRPDACPVAYDRSGKPLPTGDVAAVREYWRSVVAAHVPDEGEQRRCGRCGEYWPCWPLMQAREELAAWEVRTTDAGKRLRSVHSGEWRRVRVAHKTGDEVRVAVESIQRSNGAAWRGDAGRVIGQTGDGYRVKFGDGFIAENVQPDQITEA
jgi:hypothetical protein